VSIGPTGDAHQISLSFNDTKNLDNAVLVSKSAAASGGLQWSTPITLIRDTNPAVFNDKESITADQNDANYVYAVWDRLVFPNERTRGQSPENTAAFRAPTYLADDGRGYDVGAGPADLRPRPERSDHRKPDRGAGNG
jgi:hypothetical protein